MSEQKTNFMSELDRWTEETIIRPWYEAVETYIKSPNDPKADDAIRTMDAVIKEAVRAKILESYRNGQAAGPRKVFKRPERAASNAAHAAQWFYCVLNLNH